MLTKTTATGALIAASVCASLGPSQIVGVCKISYHGLRALSNRISIIWSEKTHSDDNEEKKIKELKQQIFWDENQVRIFLRALVPVIGFSLATEYQLSLEPQPFIRLEKLVLPAWSKEPLPPERN